MFSANSSQVSEDRLYVEDVFSTYLYTGNGSTQTITNGIDIAGKGGLVWMKSRSTAGDHHVLTDTVTGATKQLASNLTDQQYTYSGFGLTSFGSTGFTLTDNSTGSYYVNGSSKTYASWTFRKAPKFFDVVTYTGNGVAGRQIAHSLGVAPGCIFVKCTSNAFGWPVYHRGLTQFGNAGTGNLVLNSTDGNQGGGTFFWNDTDATSTVFTLGSSSNVNQNGATYVAYLFAHDTTSDGIIQCGSFTTDGSGNATVNLGWEPQWILSKKSSDVGSWFIVDTMRGMPVGSNDAQLLPNTSGAEISPGDIIDPTATGFLAKNISSSTTYIYIAIRRGPMRTPTSGTSVMELTAYTGNNTSQRVIGSSVTPDMVLLSDRGATSAGWTTNYAHYVFDRLRDSTSLATAFTAAEITGWGNYIDFDRQDGWDTGPTTDQSFLNASSVNYISRAFKRAPSFFDVVCYTGTGSARTVNHNLGVAPELMIIKSRSSGGSSQYNWMVYSAAIWGTGVAGYPGYDLAVLNTTAPAYYDNTLLLNNTQPTSSVFSLGTATEVNSSGVTYVAYLFASCPGVSKCGSYTGNGSSQTINCGFAAGARFVMIKRADNTGDWYVWDTARGIVAGNDPRLSLNSTAAEVTTDDSVDTDSSGFVVNQLSATNINVSSATYIYLAVA